MPPRLLPTIHWGDWQTSLCSAGRSTTGNEPRHYHPLHPTTDHSSHRVSSRAHVEAKAGGWGPGTPVVTMATTRQELAACSAGTGVAELGDTIRNGAEVLQAGAVHLAVVFAAGLGILQEVGCPREEDIIG